jgi:hypothetical protein
MDTVVPGCWVLAMPVAERSGDLRASQKIVNLPAVLVVIGGQPAGHIVAGLADQQGEQGSNSAGCDHVGPVVAGDRIPEELADAWPAMVAGHPRCGLMSPGMRISRTRTRITQISLMRTSHGQI